MVALVSALRPDSCVVAEFRPSPNHGERKNDVKPDMLVLHYTGMSDADAALSKLCFAGSEVSAHYLVMEDGYIVQCVPEARRAWHAGTASWDGETDVNSCSIGVEIVNPGHDALPPFPASQIEGVIALLRDIGARYEIAPQRVLAHSDVAPARKIDPGEHFPWETLWRAGIGHWVAPAQITGEALYGRGREGPPIRALQALLALYGYGVDLTGVYDAQTEIVVAAFQRHFRPERVDGQADASTIETLRALISGLEKP
jgi:N-acetylmuramoyl-L-alanine amidase